MRAHSRTTLGSRCEPQFVQCIIVLEGLVMYNCVYVCILCAVSTTLVMKIFRKTSFYEDRFVCCDVLVFIVKYDSELKDIVR